jgi:hypothetical protein
MHRSGNDNSSQRGINMSEKYSTANAYVRAMRDLENMPAWASNGAHLIASPLVPKGMPEVLAEIIAERWTTIVEEATQRGEERAATALNALRVAVEQVTQEPEEPPEQEERDDPSGVSPMAIAYDNTTNLTLYHNVGALIIAGEKAAVRSSTTAMQNARAAGAEVLQYIVPADWPDAPYGNQFERDYYEAYGTPALWPFAERSKWEGSLLSDMRPGSAWILYTVEFIADLITADQCDGVFLDTVGARTYAATANWDSWSAEEKDAYMLGNIDLVRRLDERRKAMGREDFLLVSNSVWFRADKPAEAALGEQYVNGVCIEHHASNSTWHRKFSGKNRRVCVIANSQTEAVAWAYAPGVTHVSGQTTPQYSNALALPFAFGFTAP